MGPPLKRGYPQGWHKRSKDKGEVRWLEIWPQAFEPLSVSLSLDTCLFLWPLNYRVKRLRLALITITWLIFLKEVELWTLKHGFICHRLSRHRTMCVAPKGFEILRWWQGVGKGGGLIFLWSLLIVPIMSPWIWEDVPYYAEQLLSLTSQREEEKMTEFISSVWPCSVSELLLVKDLGLSHHQSWFAV